MGGVVPFGYRLGDRRLHVDEEEAAIVRLIFALYLELGSVRALQGELRQRDIRSRVRKLASGRIVGGVHLTNGPLSHLLRNRHYLGQINHRGQSWPGEHTAIVDAETFAKVQAKLDGQRVERATRLKSNALLIGKLFNETGERLTPSYAIKRGVRYRYYISTSAMQAQDRAAPATRRLPAPALETAVIDVLRSAIERQALKSSERDVGFEAAADPRNISGKIDGRSPSQARTSSSCAAAQARFLIEAYLVRVVVGPDRLEIGYRADLNDPHATETLSAPWTKPATRLRRAILMPSSPSGQSRTLEAGDRDRLILAVATARSWLEELVKGTISDIGELAANHKRTPRSIRMTLSLAFLDPVLIDAACAGALQRGYGVTRLMDLPSRFADQWRALGLQRPA
jgi:site-specific DNA recombinase